MPQEDSASSRDSPDEFLNSTALLDLEDSRLRLRARSLTQLCESESDKAVAIHNYVKRMPFERRLKLRLRTAREVMDAGAGDASDKATLLIALLRRVGIPARIRYIELRNETMRGLSSSTENAFRPLAEVWLDGDWVRTDSYIFDVAYMAAARQRLKDLDWERGYGIHRNGHSVWNGAQDAFVGGAATEDDPMVVQTLGVYDDPMQFMRSDFLRHRYPPFAHSWQINMRAIGMRYVLRELRAEGTASAQSKKKRRRP